MIEKLSFINFDHHKNLVRTISKDCFAKDEIIGLMLIGSVARGDAYPESDLDLYFLLADGLNKKFHSEVKENILIEYKYADFNQVQLNFENNPMEIYSFLDGEILFDKKGFLKHLTQIAQQKYKDYCISDNKIKGISHWLQSSLNKIKAALNVNDELKASYVITTSTWVMLEGVWAINNKPMPPSGAVWVHLKELPHLPTNLEDLLNNMFLGNTTERINSTIIIIEWILFNLDNKTTIHY